MSRELSIPFARGETGYSGDTIESPVTRFAQQLGQVRGFDDWNPNLNVVNTNLQVVCILLRNLTGGALLPSQAVLFSATTPSTGTGATVTQTGTQNVFFGIVDEYLPAAGVPNNDVFWLVIKGPTTALMTTVSGAKTAGQLAVWASGTDNGKLDFTPTTAATAIIGQNQATYGQNAFTLGAIANGATSARVILNRNFLGQA